MINTSNILHVTSHPSLFVCWDFFLLRDHTLKPMRNMKFHKFQIAAINSVSFANDAMRLPFRRYFHERSWWNVKAATVLTLYIDIRRSSGNIFYVRIFWWWVLFALLVLTVLIYEIGFFFRRPTCWRQQIANDVAALGFSSAQYETMLDKFHFHRSSNGFEGGHGSFSCPTCNWSGQLQHLFFSKDLDLLPMALLNWAHSTACSDMVWLRSRFIPFGIELLRKYTHLIDLFAFVSYFVNHSQGSRSLGCEMMKSRIRARFSAKGKKAIKLLNALGVLNWTRRLVEHVYAALAQGTHTTITAGTTSE